MTEGSEAVFPHFIYLNEFSVMMLQSVYLFPSSPELISLVCSDIILNPPAVCQTSTRLTVENVKSSYLIYSAH